MFETITLDVTWQPGALDDHYQTKQEVRDRLMGEFAAAEELEIREVRFEPGHLYAVLELVDAPEDIGLPRVVKWGIEQWLRSKLNEQAQILKREFPVPVDVSVEIGEW